MNGAFHVAAIGMQAQQSALELLGHNVANMNTAAYKRQGIRFQEMLAGGGEPQRTADGATTPPPALVGVRMAPALALDAQGEIERTNAPLDVAIDGAGFIELMGNEGRLLLWRGGALSVREDGQLQAADHAMPLRAMISVPTDAQRIAIAADGRVRAITADAPDGVEIGQINLVMPRDQAALQRLDGGLYTVGDAGQVRDATAGEDGMGQLVQGALERSNVDLNMEMVQLLIVQRAYAANAQIVQAADQIQAIANNLRR
jgi:flagellar basal-body rod protein FlgG